MKKKIVLIVGPSGSGKTNLMSISFDKDQIIRSTTTRKPRPGEINGKDYLFVNSEEYNSLVSNNELIQTAYYDGNNYGVTKKEISDKFKKFNVLSIAVVMNTVKDYVEFGKLNNIKIIPVFCSISKYNLINHFKNRTESDALKQQRIDKYEIEMENIKFFDDDHIVYMNKDDYGKTASKYLKGIINK